MQSKTFIKAYVIIMTVLCLTLATCLLVLSYQRGNDRTCNVASVGIIFSNILVWSVWPKASKLSNIEMYAAFRKQQRIELKKKLKALDVLN